MEPETGIEPVTYALPKRRSRRERQKPVDVEPETGIEPVTYALRERRYTD